VITKEIFCKTLQMINEQHEINDKFEDALDLVGDGYFVYGANNKYYEALLLVLKEAMNDQYDYIDWWLHDATDDKRVWSAGMEKEWDLNTPEALYDFIRDECQDESIHHQCIPKDRSNRDTAIHIYRFTPFAVLQNSPPEYFSLDDTMEEGEVIDYPEVRNLDDIKVKLNRNGETVNICITDLHEEEQSLVMNALDNLEMAALAQHLAQRLRFIGDIFEMRLDEKGQYTARGRVSAH